jgi:hypothetical protein
MANTVKKVYLGDSVYAALEGDRVVLTTENGFGPSNTIVLEPKVFEALNRYVGAHSVTGTTVDHDDNREQQQAEAQYRNHLQRRGITEAEHEQEIGG